MSVESLLLGVLKTRSDKRAVSLAGYIWSTFLCRDGLHQRSSKLLVSPPFLSSWNAVVALLLHSHTNFNKNQTYNQSMQKGTWEGGSWHCKDQRWVKTSQYFFADSVYSKSSWVLTEVQDLNKEGGCWSWRRQNLEITIGNNYSAIHLLRLYCISWKKGEAVVLFFSSLCFCRVQGELHDQELNWSWKEHTKGSLWTSWPAFPSSGLAPHCLWMETEDSQNGAQGMWRGSNRGKQESGSCRFLPHTEEAHSPHTGVPTQKFAGTRVADSANTGG